MRERKSEITVRFLQTSMRIIVILAEIKIVVTWLQLLQEGGLHRVLQLEFLHYMLGKGWLIKSLRHISTIVFGKLRKNDTKFTRAVLLCIDCYCLLTSKVTFVFIPFILLCFLIICKYLCSLTYWYLFCLFFPRIPNVNKGSLIALCVSNIFFMLPWQFAQFVLLTQVRPYSPLHGLFVYFKQIDYFVQAAIEYTIILMLSFQLQLLSGKIHPTYHTRFFLSL